MHDSQATIADQITKQLSLLLDLEVSQVQSAYQEGGSPWTILRVSVFDTGQREYPLVLKTQDNDVAYRLYQQYLEPYHLNSPKEYGYVELNGQRLLVMDYIRHLPTNWEDSTSYLRAVQWLLKKDLVTQQNMDSVRNLDCLGEMPYYGVDYWLSQFEKWHKDSTSDRQARDVSVCVSTNRNRISEYIGELNEEGAQTVVHGDFYLDNILFGGDETSDELFVIDWTQPHISSVTKDLVGLCDTAPDTIKSELIEMYREHIDFHRFDEILGKARLLRDIGYLSWMAWMINVGQKEGIAQSEVDRVATSIILSLENG